MHDKIKLKTFSSVFPSLSILRVVLSFDNLFFQSKTIPKAAIQNKMREWHIVLSFSSIANEHGTISVGFFRHLVPAKSPFGTLSSLIIAPAPPAKLKQFVKVTSFTASNHMHLVCNLVKANRFNYRH